MTLKAIGNERTDLLMYKKVENGVLWVTLDGGFKFYQEI